MRGQQKFGGSLSTLQTGYSSANWVNIQHRHLLKTPREQSLPNENNGGGGGEGREAMCRLFAIDRRESYGRNVPRSTVGGDVKVTKDSRAEGGGRCGQQHPSPLTSPKAATTAAAAAKPTNNNNDDQRTTTSPSSTANTGFSLRHLLTPQQQHRCHQEHCNARAKGTSRDRNV